MGWLTISPVVNQQHSVTSVFAALADPTRRRIMETLSRRGETQATSLARPFRISMPAISRHLRVLEHARLVRRRRSGRLHLFRARASGLRKAQRWISQYAAGWDFSFDALDRLLDSEKKREKSP